MLSDILSDIINWAVAGLVAVMAFLLRKIFFYDTKIAVLEQQFSDREKHLDQQLKDLKTSVERIEGLLIEASHTQNP